jgi:predicted Zn finger-like uncharacterized protein
MLISCSHCQARYTVPDAASGKQATCAKCKQPFVVAAQSVAASGQAVRKATSRPVAAQADVAAPKSRPSRLSERELMAAFVGEMPRRRRRIGYHLGIVSSAAAMLVLPLVYFGLIGLVARGCICMRRRMRA